MCHKIYLHSSPHTSFFIPLDSNELLCGYKSFTEKQLRKDSIYCISEYQDYAYYSNNSVCPSGIPAYQFDVDVLQQPLLARLPVFVSNQKEYHLPYKSLEVQLTVNAGAHISPFTVGEMNIFPNDIKRILFLEYSSPVLFYKRDILFMDSVLPSVSKFFIPKHEPNLIYRLLEIYQGKQ